MTDALHKPIAGPRASRARRGVEAARAPAAVPAAKTWTAVGLLGGAAALHRKVDTSLDAHELLAEGLPAVALDTLVDRVGLLRDSRNFTAALGMSLRTLQRKKAEATHRLSREQSGRMWTFAEILSRASQVFGSQSRAEAWLVQPATALDRRTPLELLSTTAGLKLVEDLLTRMDYGVYT